ncbi:P2Y purinoceptor 1-like [Oreochromis aureus]|uniref:P2Y purinoceptor 1-like n=1 Tax=Oreochromis aureus TaxID=47969 RepID=UPI001953B743|nr:P2Y purinoceptor 1-like [Oreochromis aureus]
MAAVPTAFQVSPPPKFDFSKPEEWPKWIHCFERFRIASGLKVQSDENQVNTLIYTMGDEDVITSLNLTEEEASEYHTLKDNLEAHFVVRRNVIFERAKFNQRQQEAGETADGFIASLYALAEHCGYGALHSEMIRDRLVVGVRDKRLSEQLQMDAELTLQLWPATYYFMGNKWIFGEGFCKIIRFCFNLNLYSSIGFLTCISVYRYLAIVHPMRVMGRITVTHSVAISVVVWLLVSAQSFPDMFYPKTSANNTDRNRTEKCHHTTTTKYVEDYLKYSVGWTLTGFVIPFLILLGSYGHVTLVLCRINTIDKVVKQRSLKLMFILILLFSVCYIPFHIFKNLSLYSRVLIKHRMRPKWDKGVFCAHQISRGLVCLNSVLNPLVYLHVMDIPAQIRQMLQRSRQIFTRFFLSKYGNVPVAQSADV